MKKLMLVVPAAVLAIAVPATAKQHPAHSHKCTPHKVSYRAGGTLTAWSLTQNADGTWSGSLTVQVTHTNHHARGDKGNSTTYTVSDAHVRFGKHATNPPAAGSRVELIGGITHLAKRCDQTGFTPTVTIRRIVVHAPKSTTTS